MGGREKGCFFLLTFLPSSCSCTASLSANHTTMLLPPPIIHCQAGPNCLPACLFASTPHAHLLPPPLKNTENFKTSRLVLQAWLQSAPELVVIGLILYRNMTPAGPAVIVPGPLLLQVCAAWRAAGRGFACCEGAARVPGWLCACFFVLAWQCLSLLAPWPVVTVLRRYLLVVKRLALSYGSDHNFDFNHAPVCLCCARCAVLCRPWWPT